MPILTYQEFSPEILRQRSEDERKRAEALGVHPALDYGPVNIYVARCAHCDWSAHRTGRELAARDVETKAIGHREAKRHTVEVKVSRMNRHHRTYFADGGES